MNTQFRVTHVWRSLAAFVLVLFWSSAIAQGNIQFLSPPAESRVPTNFDQEVTIEWMAGDRPVRADVTLTTTLGHIPTATIKTDDFGRATFTINSDTEGYALLDAAGGTANRTLSLNFDAVSAGDDLAEITPVQPPYGQFGVLRRDEHGTGLWLAKDRIGFLIADNFQLSDIDDFRRDNAVIEVNHLSDSVLSLVFQDNDRVIPLRELARELEAIEGPELAGTRPVRRAGLVAMIDGTDQSFVVPDEIIIKFVDVPSDAVKGDFRAQYKLSSLEPLGRNPRRFVARIHPDQVKDPIQLATDISMDDLVQLVDPNFIVAVRPRSASTEEPGFNLQWYHENNGEYATEDADIDSAGAWQFTEGSKEVMIAVIDSGFDIYHPDLIENLDEEDPTLFAIDLVDHDEADLLDVFLGFEAFGHGTRAAGVAAARGGNGKGYAGSCPRCQLLLIRVDPETVMIIAAFDEAVFRGSKVISNSWGWFGISDNLADAMRDAVVGGATVLMAMSNSEDDNCGTVGDTSSVDAVIAVSGATDYDKRSPYAGEALGYGTCMDVLAPTRGGKKGIHTTSVELTPDGKLATYWHNFSGTSAATPMVAGVVGLLKTLDDTLTPMDVQRILQDTADRVDPKNALYATESGFSNPGGIPTHGYGRINAFEAARLIATPEPADQDIPPGRGGRDLLLRDNPLDWGNTEQPSDTIFDSPRGQYTDFKSVDIKIDVDPFGTVVTTAAGFAALVPDEPEVGKSARVYVRTRNRGPKDIKNSSLKLHAAVVDDTIPDLPGNFWSLFPVDADDTDTWQPIDTITLTTVSYSGASIAGCPERTVPRCHPDDAITDPAIIKLFNLPPMVWDSEGGQRLALLVAVNSATDPLQGKLVSDGSFDDVLTAVHLDNNVTLWVSSQPESGGGYFDLWMIALIVLAFLLRLTSRQATSVRLRTGE